MPDNIQKISGFLKIRISREEEKGFLWDLWSIVVECSLLLRGHLCRGGGGRRSPGAISLFANDLSAVISGIYCGIPAPVVVEENKFQSIIAVVHRSSVTAMAV